MMANVHNEHKHKHKHEHKDSMVKTSSTLKDIKDIKKRQDLNDSDCSPLTI